MIIQGRLTIWTNGVYYLIGWVANYILRIVDRLISRIVINGGLSSRQNGRRVIAICHIDEREKTDDVVKIWGLVYILLIVQMIGKKNFICGSLFRQS